MDNGRFFPPEKKADTKTNIEQNWVMKDIMVAINVEQFQTILTH